MRLLPPLIVAFAACFILATLTGCGGKAARSRPTAVSAPVNTQKLATKAFDNLKTNLPLDDDRRANAFIICVTDEVIRNIPGDWEIAIFKQRSPSLFVLPGRKIGVNGGIMNVARNQHQLAALIAHSLAHVQSNHTDKRLTAALGATPTNDPYRAVERPFSQEGEAILGALGVITDRTTAAPFDSTDESEANALGLEILARAGFNPRESALVWNALENSSAARSSGMAVTHPGPGNRAGASDANMDHAIRMQQEALATRKKPDCDRIRR